MILNVLCSRALCGGRTIFHPLSVAMLKSPRLKGSAMLALLGTLSRICQESGVVGSDCARSSVIRSGY